MKAFTTKLSLVVLALGTASFASASPIFGSLSLAGFGVTQDSSDLSVSTLITSAFAMTTNPTGALDYTPIPSLSVFSTTALDLTNLVTFTLSNASFGTFTTASGSIIQQTPNNLDVFLLGTFTPGASLPGKDPTSSSLRLSFNQSGSSISEAITLSSPPAFPTPEPATVALLGGSLIGLGLFGRKRFRR